MPTEPADLLIEARWVLPIAPVNTVLEDHAVAVTDGRIVALGPTGPMNQRFEPRERVIRSDHALSPGFVDAHTSAAMTLLRELPVAGTRMSWLRNTVWPVQNRCSSAEFVRDGTQLAIAEMLRAGITSFAGMSLFPEAAARAASTARMRAAIGLPVADAANIWANGATEHLAKAERLWDEYQSDPWVSLYFAPQDGVDLSEETLLRVRRVADELDARVAMAVHGSEVELQESMAAHRRRPLQRLHELGLLRPGFTAIHMNCLDENDLETVSTTGICVVACMQADRRFGAPCSPLRQLALQQVPTGLGSCDPLSAGAFDVLAESRSAAHLGRVSAAQALHLATLGGATALGFGSLTGSIEPGKAADLVCWDFSAVASPAVEPVAARLADCLVFGATRRQANDVWTSGRAVLRDGHLLACDEREMRALARQWAQRLRTREQL